MGINPVSDYSSLFANYKVPEIPSVDLDRIKKPEAVSANAQAIDQPIMQETNNDIDLSIEEKPKRAGNADVHELSLSFNINEDYSYIGQDSDIESLDIQKAISDMKKDQVLQQYQYFVGSAEDLFSGNSEKDGNVFLKF